MSGLFTVLIAEKEHIDAIKEKNRLFFEPFLNSKELAFCYWNPEGQTLEESVPGLLDAVGREKKWRAVIVNNKDEDCLKTQNPFDTVNRKALSDLEVPERFLKNAEEKAEDAKVKPKTAEELEKEALERFKKWEKDWIDYFEKLKEAKKATYKAALDLPLQKLSTWLCYRPEMFVSKEVQEKQNARDWALENLTKDSLKCGEILEELEREQYKFELRMKEELRKDFIDGKLLNIAYPGEVYCISTRTAENNFFDPENYWNIYREGDYSSFADRNMYFDKMRFMVFDLYPETHRDFRTDYIRFLATILVFASNQAPASVMQARRLYQLEVETDETPLRTMVTSYDKKLAVTSENIDGEMERIRNDIPCVLTDKRAEELFCASRDVDVKLDSSCKPNKVLADNHYGYFYDSPRDEYSKWTDDHRASEKELNYIVKQQERAVRKYASYAHYSSEVSDVNISRLTPHQIEDVRDFTNAAEEEMVTSIPPDLSDVSEYKKRLEEKSEEVKKKIAERMTKKTTLILGAVCLGLYLICFLPFLLHNHGSFKTVTTAIGLSALMIGLMAAILVVTVIFLRRSITGAVGKYNDTARGVIADIEAGLKNASKYLSALSNARRGHAIQNYANNNVDQYTKGLRIRMKHKEDIRKKRAYLKEDYIDYFGDDSIIDEVMARPYTYDFNLQKEYDYPAPFLAGDCRQIEFMSCGNYVSVPSSYITKISVRMEGMYD